MNAKTIVIAALCALFLTPALAEGDPIKGQRVFKKCQACHTIEAGRHKIGPSLYNIVGAKAGADETYKYSKALLETDLVWDDETLTAFLKAPRAVLPGSKMIFAGLRKDDDIENVIAYIVAQSENSRAN